MPVCSLINMYISLRKWNGNSFTPEACQNPLSQFMLCEILVYEAAHSADKRKIKRRFSESGNEADEGRRVLQQPFNLVRRPHRLLNQDSFHLFRIVFITDRN